MNTKELNNELGNIDIYLLDQILKARYTKGTKILDAGCGEGRNLIYFLNNGFDVWGIDQNPDAIRMLHFILGSTYPNCPKDNFKQSSVESMDYDDHTFDLVISSAVLHFAKSHDHFDQMFLEMIRVLKPGGQIFVRMTSNIGLASVKDIDIDGCSFLADGSFRYLISREKISNICQEFNLDFVEPIKNTNVNDLRCMTTLILRKKEEGPSH